MRPGRSKDALWDQPEAWAAACAGATCPICVKGAPDDVVGELSVSWVTAQAHGAPLPGYACVVSKRHVVEPFELPPSERQAFWADCMLTAEILADLHRPVKMNYQISGNSIPHLHMHLFPRFRGDPWGGGPLDPKKGSFDRTPSDLARLGERLRPKLGVPESVRRP